MSLEIAKHEAQRQTFMNVGYEFILETLFFPYDYFFFIRHVNPDHTLNKYVSMFTWE